MNTLIAIIIGCVLGAFLAVLIRINYNLHRIGNRLGALQGHDHWLMRIASRLNRDDRDYPPIGGDS